MASEKWVAPETQQVKQEPNIARSDINLLHRLRNSTAELTIRVNQVELSLDVVDVHKNDQSVCCLVKHAGMRCRIPRSENVEIDLEGTTYRTAFLGSWHTIEWLGLHLVVFPVLEKVDVPKVP
ncbi:MAG: hypothetical protein E6R03_08880 [Hyphomicrobiaceae bacterium]|nr:MAG: hypothetical protein E6R03_08880 [Hyphomicrobiaceae bacterium]